MSLAIRTRVDGHHYLKASRVVLIYLWTWLAPSLFAFIISQMILFAVPNGPVGESPVLVVIFMLLYGFLFSWLPLIAVILVGILFLKRGIAGWAIAICLGGAAAGILEAITTQGELFPYAILVGGFYGMFLWAGLWFWNRNALSAN